MVKFHNLQIKESRYDNAIRSLQYELQRSSNVIFNKFNQTFLSLSVMH